MLIKNWLRSQIHNQGRIVFWYCCYYTHKFIQGTLNNKQAKTVFSSTFIFRWVHCSRIPINILNFLQNDNGLMGQQSFVTGWDWLRANRHYNCPGAWSAQINEEELSKPVPFEHEYVADEDNVDEEIHEYIAEDMPQEEALVEEMLQEEVLVDDMPQEEIVADQVVIVEDAPLFIDQDH